MQEGRAEPCRPPRPVASVSLFKLDAFLLKSKKTEREIALTSVVSIPAGRQSER